MASTVEELTARDRLKLREFLAALQVFTDLEPNMPIQMVRAFIYTALNEGVGSVEIGRQAGLPSGVIARHLGDWGKFDRYGRPGHDMIEGRSTYEDRRSRLQFLTAKGRGKLGAILNALRGGNHASKQ